MTRMSQAAVTYIRGNRITFKNRFTYQWTMAGIIAFYIGIVCVEIIAGFIRDFGYINFIPSRFPASIPGSLMINSSTSSVISIVYQSLFWSRNRVRRVFLSCRSSARNSSIFLHCRYQCCRTKENSLCRFPILKIFPVNFHCLNHVPCYPQEPWCYIIVGKCMRIIPATCRKDGNKGTGIGEFTPC